MAMGGMALAGLGKTIRSLALFAGWTARRRARWSLEHNPTTKKYDEEQPKSTHNSGGGPRRIRFDIRRLYGRGK